MGLKPEPTGVDIFMYPLRPPLRFTGVELAHPEVVVRGVPLPPLARASSRLGAGAVRLSRFESSVAVCELAAWRARRAARCVGCVEWEPRNGRVPAVAAIDRNTCVTVLAARWGEVVGVTV